MTITVPAARARALVLFRWPNASLSIYRKCSITPTTDHYNAHAWGNALDIKNQGLARNPLAMTNAQIQEAVTFGLKNHEAYDIEFILWLGKSYSAESGWKGVPLPPEPFPQHMDHAHFSFLPRYEGTPEGCPPL